ncbi:MAG TPA: DUF790 family protein [Pyrinomonadaceae bacterium]|jgi:hypothetical protein
MLTADLAQSWRRGTRTGPRYIDRDDAGYLRDADALINLFDVHQGHARKELDQALEEYVGAGTDYRILRGLIKLLMDRCLFETASDLEPAEIRRALFLRAQAVHPVINAATREQLWKETALELGCDSESLPSKLYADLPENQELLKFDVLKNEELLDLYNLAQAQALLYRCVEMRLWVEPQSAAGYRELFGAIKSYRLIHTVRGTPSRGYEIRLDGPVSIFHRSQKYGVQMAVFLPALLLCTGWRMRAEIEQKPGAGHAFFELESDQHELRSHYLSPIPYENPVLEKFYDAWQRFESDWTLEASSEVLSSGDNSFIPDFVLVHPQGQQVYLEILGFWTPEHLRERLRELDQAGIRNFILAAWEELRGSREPLSRIPPRAIVFKRNLDPVMVELAINEFLHENDWKALPL